MKIINKTVEKEIWFNLVKDFSAYGSMAFHFVLGIFILLLDFSLFIKFVITLGSTYIVLTILRALFFARRPKGKDYRTLVGKVERNSEFSAHTASMFALAFVIGLNTNKYVFIFLLILALFIGLSRIYLKKHYPRHVFAGAIIGIIIGLLINLFVF